MSRAAACRAIGRREIASAGEVLEKKKKEKAARTIFETASATIHGRRERFYPSSRSRRRTYDNATVEDSRAISESRRGTKRISNGVCICCFQLNVVEIAASKCTCFFFMTPSNPSVCRLAARTDTVFALVRCALVPLRVCAHVETYTEWLPRGGHDNKQTTRGNNIIIPRRAVVAGRLAMTIDRLSK